MRTLAWIILSGVVMGVLGLVGAVTLILREGMLPKILLPLVAFAAGSLVGGALFHMIPESIQEMGNGIRPYLWIVGGFLLFLGLDQFLSWHCHWHEAKATPPFAYLVLIADAIHNSIDGLFVSASLLVDIRLGITALLATAAHELPQELGDFAVQVHGGLSKRKAPAFCFVSQLTFFVGGLAVYGISRGFDVAFLVPFAAGDFPYIGAADLIPEVKKEPRVGDQRASLSGVCVCAWHLFGATCCHAGASIEDHEELAPALHQRLRGANEVSRCQRGTESAATIGSDQQRRRVLSRPSGQLGRVKLPQPSPLTLGWCLSPGPARPRVRPIDGCTLTRPSPAMWFSKNTSHCCGRRATIQNRGEEDA
jgi:zinc and cadmium transporter